MNKIIYLTRHSEQYKDLKYISKCEDSQIANEKIILSEKGQNEAKQISNLKELKNIDKVYSSNYVRAISTAKYISNNNSLNINIDNRLGERKLGDLVELEKLGKNKNNPFTLEQILDIKLKNIAGESREEVSNRMLDVFNEILDSEGNNIFIVSHAAAIKFYLMNYCNLKYNNLIFKDKIISVYYPNILKLEFEDKNLINISNIIVK